MGYWLTGPSLPAVETGNLGEHDTILPALKGSAKGGSTQVGLRIAVPGEPVGHWGIIEF